MLKSVLNKVANWKLFDSLVHHQQLVNDVENIASVRNCPDITILNSHFLHDHNYGLGHGQGLHQGISYGVGHGVSHVVVHGVGHEFGHGVNRFQS